MAFVAPVVVNQWGIDPTTSSRHAFDSNESISELLDEILNY